MNNPSSSAFNINSFENIACELRQQERIISKSNSNQNDYPFDWLPQLRKVCLLVGISFKFLLANKLLNPPDANTNVSKLDNADANERSLQASPQVQTENPQLPLHNKCTHGGPASNCKHHQSWDQRSTPPSLGTTPRHRTGIGRPRSFLGNSRQMLLSCVSTADHKRSCHICAGHERPQLGPKAKYARKLV